MCFFYERYYSPTLHFKPDLIFLDNLITLFKTKPNELSQVNVSGHIVSELEKHLQNAIDSINANTD
jgi:hypothetical protein